MTELSLYQDAAVALAEYACGWEHGRSKDDAVYRDVTESRDAGAFRQHYSSCGDLGNWLLWRLGLECPWLNRAKLGHYRVGGNVAELGFNCPIAHPPPTDPPDWRPEPGSICEIWNSGTDAHVFVMLGPGSDDAHIRTANYGAGGMSASAWPGANIADSPFIRFGDGWLVGLAHPRRLQRVIRIADAVPLITAQIDLTGARVTGELIDALQAKWEPANGE